MKTKLLSLFVALIATNALWASNTITYAATIKLTRSSLNVGETTFGPAITSHTFSNGTGTITCSGEVTTIGRYAFSDCSGLTSVTIPNSVTTIGEYAFDYCSGLTSVTIPNSVTTIGRYAFENCSGLTSVTIPNSVTTIGSYAFYKCSGLTKTNYTGTIADWCKIKFGGSSANPMSCSHNFYINDVEVKDLVIPEGVDTIGDYAFENCSGLTSVTIPNSVTTIGEYAFSNCNGLTKTNYTGTIADWCKIKFGNYYAANPMDYSHNFYINDVEVKDLVIPNGVDTIGEYAFSGCSGLTSVTIPNSVTTIGDDAFFGCSGLTKTNYTGTIADWCKIKFGNYYAANPMDYSHNFYINDVEVKDLVIPNGVDTIGEYAFSGCSGLTSVTIPNSVTTIGDDAFFGCSGLTKTNYTGTIADWCKIKFGSSGANPMSYSHNFYINDVEVKDLVIPEGVDTIGNGAFYNCSGLTSVTIPNSVTTIGNSTFYNCSGLTSVTIPNSVTTIGNFAFRGCSGLTSVTIPNSVTTIGRYAFDYCSGLTKTNYTGTIADWCKIKFDRYDANPMYYSHNFYINDVEVKDLVIPEGVDTIGDYAFYNCSGLTSVTIPNSVTTIGNYAFYCCNGVRTITCYAVNPPTATGTTFEGISQYTKTYVLASSLEDYQFAIGWMDLNLLPIGEPTDLLSLPFEEKEGIGSAKFIHNGQLFIRRNGVLFNAHGARVK